MRRRLLGNKASGGGEISQEGILFSLDSVDSASYDTSIPDKWNDTAGGKVCTITVNNSNYYDPIDKAIIFDEASEYLTLNSDLTIPAGDFTMGLYLNPRINSSANSGFFRDGAASNGVNFIILNQTYPGLPWVRIAGTDILKPTTGYSMNENTGSNIYLTFVFKNYIDASNLGSITMYVGDEIKHFSTHSKVNTGFIIRNLNWQFQTAANIKQNAKAWHFYNRALTQEELLGNKNALQSVHG